LLRNDRKKGGKRTEKLTKKVGRGGGIRPTPCQGQPQSRANGGEINGPGKRKRDLLEKNVTLSGEVCHKKKKKKEELRLPKEKGTKSAPVNSPR